MEEFDLCVISLQPDIVFRPEGVGVGVSGLYSGFTPYFLPKYSRNNGIGQCFYSSIPAPCGNDKEN
jgi:hypothetical protein